MTSEDDQATDFPITCPYCGEQVEIYLEPDVSGRMIVDCEVCCQPMQVRVKRGRGGRGVEISRGDGSE